MRSIAFLTPLLTVIIAAAACAQDTPVYFAPESGPARAGLRPDGFEVRNATVAMQAVFKNGSLDRLEFQNTTELNLPSLHVLPFVLLLGDGSLLQATTMKVVSAPKVVELGAMPAAPPGWHLSTSPSKLRPRPGSRSWRISTTRRRAGSRCCRACAVAIS